MIQGERFWLLVLALAIALPPVFKIWRLRRWQISLGRMFVLVAIVGLMCWWVREDALHIRLILTVPGAPNYASCAVVAALCSWLLTRSIAAALSPKTSFNIRRRKKD